MEEDLPEGFRLVGQEQAITNLPEGFRRVEAPTTQSLLPEAGTYTQDDMVEDDNMYSIIENFMYDRYGKDEFMNNSREQIVDKFLNNRRGVSAGNTVRGLYEWDYINDIKGDEDKMARAAAAYHLYENMANLFSIKAYFIF